MNSLRNSTSSGATNMNDVRYLIFADYFVSYNDDVCTLSHFPNYLYGNFSGYPVALFKDFTTTE